MFGGADEDRTRDLLTASSVLPLKTQDLRLFLQEIPTYSNLCNLQMQAKRKREECGFDSLLAEDGLIKPG